MGLPAFKESEEYIARAVPVDFAVRDMQRPADFAVLGTPRQEELRSRLKRGESIIAEYRRSVGRLSDELRSSSQTVFDVADKPQLIKFRLDLLSHIAAMKAICRQRETFVVERIQSIEEFDAEVASGGKPRHIRRFFHQLNRQVVAQLRAHLAVTQGYLAFLKNEQLADVDRRLRIVAASRPALDEAVADLEARYPVVAAYLAR